MKILKVSDTQRCIEFINKKGEFLVFFEHLRDFQDRVLNDYINISAPAVGLD